MKKTCLFTTVIAVALILTSCKSKKAVSDSGGIIMDTPATPEMEVMLRKIMDTQVDYKWFSATGQGKVDWDGQRLSAKVNVRILRDSIIWVQIQKLGFEVGRMMVTPDSAFFINRFDHTYSVGRTKDLLEEYNVPADFEMFSLVFTAGAYIPHRIKNSTIEPDGSVLLKSANGMEARHWFDQSSMLARSLITDPMSREWYTVYSDYQKTNSGQQFPYTRANKLVIDGQPNIFDLEYSEMTIDKPQEFPFSIPSHYEKI